jgi:DNA-binding Lrp family transcriptional regulator
MKQHPVLRPLDIPVALRLAERPDLGYKDLHDDLGISASTAHDAVQRLELAGLLYPHRRRVNRLALLEFLEHGIRYAFPAVVTEGNVRGIPTGHAAPALASEMAASHAMVWPDASGSAIGDAVRPLYEQAVELPGRCVSVYEMLTLVDALRVGRARERKLAAARLREKLRPTMSTPAERV